MMTTAVVVCCCGGCDRSWGGWNVFPDVPRNFNSISANGSGWIDFQRQIRSGNAYSAQIDNNGIQSESIKRTKPLGRRLGIDFWLTRTFRRGASIFWNSVRRFSWRLCFLVGRIPGNGLFFSHSLPIPSGTRLISYSVRWWKTSHTCVAFHDFRSSDNVERIRGYFHIFNMTAINTKAIYCVCPFVVLPFFKQCLSASNHVKPLCYLNHRNFYFTKGRTRGPRWPTSNNETPVVAVVLLR